MYIVIISYSECVLYTVCSANLPIYLRVQLLKRIPPSCIGAGLIEGYGFGINTMAFFLTRSTLELQSLVKAMGGRAETVSGLSGMGGK